MPRYDRGSRRRLRQIGRHGGRWKELWWLVLLLLFVLFLLIPWLARAPRVH